MEKVIDSRKEKLDIPTVIIMAVEQINTGKPVDKVLAAIAAESTLPNADVVQFGNTVFITQIAEDKSKSFGRALNVDTARNFVSNGLKFFAYLQDKGVERFITYWSGDTYDSALKAWEKRLNSIDVDEGEEKTVIQSKYADKYDSTVMAVKIGTESLF